MTREFSQIVSMKWLDFFVFKRNQVVKFVDFESLQSHLGKKVIFSQKMSKNADPATSMRVEEVRKMVSRTRQFIDIFNIEKILLLHYLNHTPMRRLIYTEIDTITLYITMY